MKLAIDKRALKETLEWAKRVAPEQNSLILSVDADSLVVQVQNDMGEYHASTLVADVEDTGSGLVERNDLLTVVVSMSGSTLSLTSDDGVLAIVGADGSSRLQMGAGTATEAPEFTVLARMKQTDFQYAVQGVKESVGKKSGKGTGSVLYGLVKVRDGESVLYATNRFLSYRASVKTRTRDVEPQAFGIVPLKWGGSVTQMTSRLELVVTNRGFYGLSDGQTMDTFSPVEAGGIALVSDLLDELHDSSASGGSLVVPKTKLNQALNTLKKQNVQARVHQDGGALYVDADSVDGFASSKTVTVSDVEGSGLDRVIIPDNLMKALRTAKSSSVQLRFPDDSRYPVSVYSNDSETLDALSFVMTVRKDAA